MTWYLGTPGRMIEMPGVASQSTEQQDRYQYSEPVEGGRVAQLSHLRVARTWPASLPSATAPEDAIALAEFASGAWGPGPWAFVSTDALVTNALTPATAACMPGGYVTSPAPSSVTPGGPVLTPAGLAARSWQKTTDARLYLGDARSPVVGSSLRLTVAAFVQGSAGAVGVEFWDASGTSVGDVESAVYSTSGALRRSFVTVTVPASAVEYRVYANAAASLVAWPTSTWTERLLPVADGQGCENAVLDGLSREVIMALSTPGYGRYVKPSFSIKELMI